MTWKPIENVAPRIGAIVWNGYLKYRVEALLPDGRVSVTGLGWPTGCPTVDGAWSRQSFYVNAHPVLVSFPLCPKETL